MLHRSIDQTSRPAASASDVRDVPAAVDVFNIVVTEIVFLHLAPLMVI